MLKLKRWSLLEDNYLINQYSILSFSKIAKKLRRTRQSIERRSQRLGLKSKYPNKYIIAKSLGHRKYQRNDKYFSKPNLENCYWAGFIAADGHLNSKTKNNKFISIHLADKDVNHLKNFAHHIMYDGPIFSPSSNGKTISIQSTQICNDLFQVFNINFGNKTPILKPPKLTDTKLIGAYIKGFIDGDGYIGLQGKQQYIRLQIGCASYKMLMWIKNNLQKHFYNKNVSIIRKINKHYWEFVLSGKHALETLLKLDKLNTPKLDRKWNKIQLCSKT